MTGEEIKALRKRLGMTQQDFAVRLGVTINSVNRWEQGHHEPSRMAKTLLEQLKERVNSEGAAE